MKRIKRRVFTPNRQNVPVTMSQDDFLRLRDFVESLCSLSLLKEIHEMKEILFYVSMQNYIEDFKQGLKEVIEIYG